MIEKIKDWMVWAETYLLLGMILVLAGLGIYAITEGIADHQKFNRILQEEHAVDSIETEIEIFSLKFTRFQPEENEEMYRYVTAKNLSQSAPVDTKAALLNQSNAIQPINGLSGSPSFLIDEQHISFWRTQFSFLLILHYGGWIFLCLFFGLFGYLNLKQEDKLLTREIERLLGSSLFLFFIGYFGFDLLNRRTIAYLNEQFNLSEPAGALSSTEMYFVLLALFLAYSLIAKAVPVQEEQDLTV